MLEMDFERALQVAEEGIAEHPDDGAMNQQIAEVLLVLHDYPRAIKHYRSALELGWENFQLHKNLAIALMEAGHYLESAEEFECAGKEKPEDYTLPLTQAKCYLQAGENEKAEVLIAELAKRFPEEAEVHYQYGLLLGGKQSYLQAISAFSKALKYKKDARYLLSRGGANASVGNMVEAKQDFEKSCELYPNNPLGFNNLGYCYFLEGAYKQAIPYFKRAIELDGNYYQAHQNLGAAYALSGELKEAEDIFRLSTQIDPAKGEGYHNLGRVLHQLGKIDSAKEILKKGVELGDEPSREFLAQIEEGS